LISMVRRRVFKVLSLWNIETPPPSILRVGSQNDMVVRHWPPFDFYGHGREEGVQNIMAAKYETPPPLLIDGEETEYYAVNWKKNLFIIFF
jgi:hypothetical protein